MRMDMKKYEIIDKVLPESIIEYDTDYCDYRDRMDEYIKDLEEEITMDEIAEFQLITYDDVDEYVRWVLDEREMTCVSMDSLGLSWRDFF